MPVARVVIDISSRPRRTVDHLADRTVGVDRDTGQLRELATDEDDRRRRARSRPSTAPARGNRRPSPRRGVRARKRPAHEQGQGRRQSCDRAGSPPASGATAVATRCRRGAFRPDDQLAGRAQEGVRPRRQEKGVEPGRRQGGRRPRRSPSAEGWPVRRRSSPGDAVPHQAQPVRTPSIWAATGEARCSSRGRGRATKVTDGPPPRPRYRVERDRTRVVILGGQPSTQTCMYAQA